MKKKIFVVVVETKKDTFVYAAFDTREKANGYIDNEIKPNKEYIGSYYEAISLDMD